MGTEIHSHDAERMSRHRSGAKSPKPVDSFLVGCRAENVNHSNNVYEVHNRGK